MKAATARLDGFVSALRKLRPLLAAVCTLFALALPAPAAAQGQMILEADELIYDYDASVISAVGDVVVEYLSYVLTADRVTYYQATARLVAVGHVRVEDDRGIVYEADQLDITDDFRDGFVEQLYVVTSDRIFVTADSARRTEGIITEFTNATYTACEVRLNHEERPPLWQVRAATVVHNEQTQRYYFEDARLEFLGVPVAYVPRLSTPDPEVARATGFLAPEVSISSDLGLGIGVPFFWAPAPNFDLTLTPTYFTSTGLLTEAEWRHRLRSGIYTVIAAGIFEKQPAPADREFRGVIRTTGSFSLHRFWRIGWDATLQTDPSFSSTYHTGNPTTPFVRSEAFLTGVIDRNYFDANAYYFQSTRAGGNVRFDQDRQGVVHPVVDYQHISNPPGIGGQLTYTANLTSVSREADDPFTVGPDTFYYGLAGSTTRLTQQMMWQRRFISDRGQVFTPFAFARADLFALDIDTPPPGLTTDPFAVRATAGAGLEWAWPFLIQTPDAHHVIEPVVQFVARPSEAMIGALPNEDAQSVMFDTTSIRSLSRFSGFDRAEGGTRLVLMLRYNGQFAWGEIEAIVGQSYQLAGINSYGVPDVNNTGTGTGLESTRSDVVAAFRATHSSGWAIDAAGRFDTASLEMQRGILAASATLGAFSVSTGIAYERAILSIEGVPQSAFLVTGRAAMELNDYWTLLTTIDYDAIAGAVVADSIGLQYECDCATLAITYSEERELGMVTDRSIMFGLQLRTLGDFGLLQR